MELSGKASGCRSPNGAQPSEFGKIRLPQMALSAVLAVGLACAGRYACFRCGRQTWAVRIRVRRAAGPFDVGRPPAARRSYHLSFKQPGVMGQLIAGLGRGPSLLGSLLFPDWQHAIFPSAKEQKAMLDGVSQFGVLMLLLLTGMGDRSQVGAAHRRRVGNRFDCRIVIPFLCGVALGLLAGLNAA